MRRTMVGLVVAVAALVGAPAAHAQIVLPIPSPQLPPPPPLPPLPDLSGITDILGLPSITGNGQQLSNAESQDRRFAITVASDPVEDQVFPVVLGFARPNTPQAPPVQRMIITAKRRTDGAVCGSSRKNDVGEVRLDVATPGDFVRNVVNGILIRDPGDYLLCGYLQDGEDDDQAVLGVANQLTVRSPRGTLDLGGPTSVAAGQSFDVTASGTEEVERQAVVTLRPTAVGGPAGCSATAADERRYGGDVVSGVIASSTTPTTLSSTVAGQVVPGRALLCGYLGEGLNDPAPEATASRAIDVVGPSACSVGQAALAKATASAQASLAAATLRGMHVTSAKARLTLAQQRLTRTKGKRARRLQTGRVKGARALVTEQTGLLTAAQSANTAQQASLAAQRTATATLCR